jgi:hypothetical protein
MAQWSQKWPKESCNLLGKNLVNFIDKKQEAELHRPKARSSFQDSEARLFRKIQVQVQNKLWSFGYTT